MSLRESEVARLVLAGLSQGVVVDLPLPRALSATDLAECAEVIAKALSLSRPAAFWLRSEWFSDVVRRIASESPPLIELVRRASARYVAFVQEDDLESLSPSGIAAGVVLGWVAQPLLVKAAERLDQAWSPDSPAPNPWLSLIEEQMLALPKAFLRDAVARARSAFTPGFYADLSAIFSAEERRDLLSAAEGANLSMMIRSWTDIELAERFERAKALPADLFFGALWQEMNRFDRAQKLEWLARGGFDLGDERATKAAARQVFAGWTDAPLAARCWWALHAGDACYEALSRDVAQSPQVVRGVLARNLRSGRALARAVEDWGDLSPLIAIQALKRMTEQERLNFFYLCRAIPSRVAAHAHKLVNPMDLWGLVSCRAIHARHIPEQARREMIACLGTLPVPPSLSALREVSADPLDILKALAPNPHPATDSVFAQYLSEYSDVVDPYDLIEVVNQATGRKKYAVLNQMHALGLAQESLERAAELAPRYRLMFELRCGDIRLRPRSYWQGLSADDVAVVCHKTGRSDAMLASLWYQRARAGVTVVPPKALLAAGASPKSMLIRLVLRAKGGEAERAALAILDRIPTRVVRAICRAGGEYGEKARLVLGMDIEGGARQSLIRALYALAREGRLCLWDALRKLATASGEMAGIANSFLAFAPSQTPRRALPPRQMRLPGMFVPLVKGATMRG